jgi:23S rRNA (cytosine1962-C5)-methyltransferase
MKRIILKKGEERRIQRGHPWVFDNEVEAVLAGPAAQAEPTTLEPGEAADVESAGKVYLGRAFVNPHSKIIARIYSPSKEGADKGFFKHRFREAVLRRMEITADGIPAYDLRRESARLLFGEADLVPGLIIDRFTGWPLDEAEAAVAQRPLTFEQTEAALGPPRSWLAVQFLSYGMDARRDLILDALTEVLEAPLFVGALPLGRPEGIVDKSPAAIRELEGLSPPLGVLRGALPPLGIVIFENGLPFALHLEEGQKTGHYLDQRDNRRLAAAFAPGGRVLDAFSYTGGFGIHAARAGAASVLCVDSSAAALDTARRNAALNGVADRVTTGEDDVFEWLRRAERRKEEREAYDLVILDPPAFAKTRSALSDALRGYRELNLRAIKLLKPGGVLVSCSCSHALDEIRFKFMLAEAAADAGRRLIQRDFRHQSPDHPILLGYDESQYLKCGFYLCRS